ncbi:conserved hypothetical protein [Pseudomonas aeruginosa 2192]|nr:conserved hypothetical protein [Pseudomonas aeruginosa 2192]
MFRTGLGEGSLKVDASLPFEQAWQNAKETGADPGPAARPR